MFPIANGGVTFKTKFKKILILKWLSKAIGYLRLKWRSSVEIRKRRTNGRDRSRISLDSRLIRKPVSRNLTLVASDYFIIRSGTSYKSFIATFWILGDFQWRSFKWHLANSLLRPLSINDSEVFFIYYLQILLSPNEVVTSVFGWWRRA